MDKKMFRGMKRITVILVAAFFLSAIFLSRVPAHAVTYGPEADNWVSSCPNGWSSKFGSSSQLRLRGWSNGPRVFRSLLRFNLSDLAGWPIDSAMLSMYWYGGGHTPPTTQHTVNLFENTSPWAETNSNWRYSDQPTQWNSIDAWNSAHPYYSGPGGSPGGGGDPGVQIIDSYVTQWTGTSWGSFPGEWFEFDVTDLVQDWAGGADNNGLLVKFQNETTIGSTVFFMYSRQAGAVEKPYLDVTVGGYYLDLNQFPWYLSENPTEKYSGAAVSEMWLSYLWWDNAMWPAGPPDLCNNTLYTATHPDLCEQQDLYDYGHNQNYDCNSGLDRLDSRGLWYTVQNLDPSGYNFSIHTEEEGDLDIILHSICRWIAYDVYNNPANHPDHVPAAVPTGGDYDNWMAIRGIHTSEDPWSATEYDIFGFWVNDPNPAGIGENSFKSITQWTQDYYHVLDVNDDDPCDGKYVAIVEPPEQSAEVRLIRPAARFERVITPVMMEKAVFVDGANEVIFAKKLEEEDALDVVQAAIDGVSHQIIPFDPLFAAAFEQTVAGEPLLVNKDGGDYYLVSFILPIVEKEKGVEIQKLNKAAGEVEQVRMIDGKIVIEPVLVDPAEMDNKDTLVVVLVDAGDGSFKEASWVDSPVKYLPVSMEDALSAVKEDGGLLGSGTGAELIYNASSPYYPDWKITVDGKIFIIESR